MLVMAADSTAAYPITCLSGPQAAATLPAGQQRGNLYNVSPRTFSPNGNITNVCVRYQYQCNANSSACSASEVKASAWRWQYTAMTPEECKDLGERGKLSDGKTSVKDVYCCSSINCNRPSPTLDPTTRVVSGVSRHQSNQASANAVKAATGANSTSKPAVALPSNSKSINGTSNKNANSKARSSSSTVNSLQCYSSIGPYKKAVRIKAFEKGSGVNACAKYMYRCTAGDVSCAAAEI